MEIKIRRTNSGLGYKEVKIIDGNTVIDLGVLDEESRRALARKFEEAVDDLVSEQP